MEKCKETKQKQNKALHQQIIHICFEKCGFRNNLFTMQYVFRFMADNNFYAYAVFIHKTQ